MDALVSTAALLAALALGLAAGAVLAEAGVLVPFWRAQTPEAFLAWYRENAARLLKFFGPLEAASGVLVAAATVAAGLARHPGAPWLAAATALTGAVLISFPLYFQRVNASFAAGTIPRERVAAELRRWAIWHWGRTVLAIGAFLLALLTLVLGATVPG
jgi:hypothetical protein